MGTFKTIGEGTLRIRGASLLDLFETAALAMLRAEYDTSLVSFEREIPVTAVGPTLEELMQAWLDRLASARAEEGFVIGDVIVVEVGRPPAQRYGDTSLTCRGAARGRILGDWFTAPPTRLRGVVPDSVRIHDRRRDFGCELELSWES